MWVHNGGHFAQASMCWKTSLCSSLAMVCGMLHSWVQFYIDQYKDIYGIVQGRHNSSALALELCLSSINLSICM